MVILKAKLLTNSSFAYYSYRCGGVNLGIQSQPPFSSRYRFPLPDRARAFRMMTG